MDRERRWFVGIDWGSQEHVVSLCDDVGRRIGQRRFAHGGTDLAEMVAWLLKESGAQPGEIMERMLRDRQFDVSELGITYYLRSLELLDAPFIAIPVFPNRFFRYSAIFVNAEKSIRSPHDLCGRRVGELLRYGHDAGIWAKGVLSDEYGVTASSMTHISVAWIVLRPTRTGRRWRRRPV